MANADDLEQEEPTTQADGAVPPFLRKSLLTWRTGAGAAILVGVACLPLLRLHPPNVQQIAATQFGGALSDAASADEATATARPEAPDPTPFPSSPQAPAFGLHRLIAPGATPAPGAAVAVGVAVTSASPSPATAPPVPPSSTHLDFGPPTTENAQADGAAARYQQPQVVADAGEGAPGYVRTAPYQLNAGTHIPLTSIDKVDSTLPGCMTMQVTRAMTASGKSDVVLVPAGATVLACYSSQANMDQARLALTAKRISYPDGTEYDMGSQPVVGVAGEQGAGGVVDTHAGRAFGQALTYTALGALGAAVSKTSSVVNLSSGISGATYSNAQQQQPTFHVDAGQPFAILLQSDLPMRPYRARTDSR
ncbi:MAG: TrbI/VirB10 family protein [Candidatus Velthaea sp.]